MTMNRIRQSIFCMMILVLSVCLGTVALHAQTSTQGAIAGTVLDPSGAVISGAAVTIHNMGTNAEIKLTSDASGFFKAPLLEPGTYKVTFAAPGFSTYHAEGVIVQVGQVSNLLPRLTVGASSSSVEVVEQAPVVNLESPDFSESLNARALQQIPINNRRWSSLAMTTPGVVSDANGYGLVAVRGISPILNNVEIDGADDNQAFFSEERGRTREAYSTSGAAVREFAVNTGVYSAEYGRAAGGVITSVTKSGTNQLHGQAYFWDRESNWNAYNDYTTLTNNAGVTRHIKPEDLRKIYGFTAGGALIKDKLFWIYTYDQHTHVFPVVGVPTNPANFYTMPATTLPTGAVCTLKPLTPEAAGNGYLSGDTSTTATEDAEACTLAARQGISYAQAAGDWASLVLGGNLNGGTTVSDLGLNSDIGQVGRMGYQEINTPKLDWQVNPKQHVSILYHRLRWDSPGGVQTTAADNYARDTQGMDYVKLDYGVVKLTSLISANIGNELLYQYGRENNNESQQPYTAYTNADLTANGNVPEVLVADSSTGWGFAAGSPYYSHRTYYPLEYKWQVGDVLYWNHGNHSLKFGVDAVHNTDTQNNLYEGNGEYVYSYLGQYMNDLLNEKNGTALASSTTGTNYGCDSNDSEYATAATGSGSQVVAGYPCYDDFYQGFGTAAYTLATMDTGIFAQDNWKVSPRLTLELGLRWDYEALPAPNPAFTAANSTSGTYFYDYPGLTNHPSDKLNFGPRLGFSYDVTGKGNTVVRGGYGMYYGRITNGNLLEVLFDTGSANAQYSPSFYNAPSGSIGEGPVFPNIFASGAAAKPTSYFFSPSLRNPSVQEYDLMVQQSIGKGTFVEFSYLGALGRELPNFLDVNLNPASLTAKTFTISDASGKGPLGATGTTFPTSVYTSFGNTNLFGASAANFAAITEMVSNVNSNYNAGVVEVLNRSLKSLQFDASYTWSHALDFSQNALTEGGTNEWYDPYTNPRINYGDSAYNVPNRFVAYALYNFPNLNTSSWVKYLANDWSLNDSFQMQNGLPYTLGISANKPSGAAANYWNGAGGSNVIPALGVNTMRYPRREVDDARLQKQVTFEQGRSLQLLLNVFNVANHQNITAIGTTAYSLSSLKLTYDGQGSANPSYNSLGVPTNSNSSGFLYTPRQVEIAARFNF